MKGVPKSLTNPQRLPGLLLGALLLLALAGACLAQRAESKWGYGRILTLNVTPVQRLPEVRYPDQGAHYVIRPKDPANVLAVAKVTLINSRSARVLILADGNAAFLEDSTGKRYEAVDPWRQRQEVQGPAAGEGQYLPFLWGTMDIQQNYQVVGWMFFEIPKQAQISRFLWEDSDPVRVNYRGR